MTPTVKDCAIAILQEQKKPLHYKEVLNLILKMRPITGATPHKSLYSVLKRSTKIKRVGAGTFLYSAKTRSERKSE